MVIDMGYTGSNFSVQKEFDTIVKNSDKRNVFRTDLDNSDLIKFKFDLILDPLKSYCQDVVKIKELMDLLLESGYIDKGSKLLNQNGSFHYLYIF